PELLDETCVVDITPVEKWLDPQAIKGYYLAVHSILSSQTHQSYRFLKFKELEILTRDFLTTYLGDGDGRVVWTGKPSLEMVIESVDEVFSFPSTLLKLKYNKPALFIKGENSPCMSDSLFPNTQKIFTNAKLSKIRNAGHLPHLSNTKDFMETVLSFLNKP
ncbi:Alpha/beta hydrolase domain-containing protein 11, partial [Orchesella cincta]